MARRRHPLLTPLDLYESYPGYDLLGLDAAPTPVTTWAEFRRDFGVDDCGDTLFKFIVYECGDECDNIRVQQKRLTTAINDLLSVRFRCEALQEDY